MKIQIITPSKNILVDEADEVIIHGPRGAYGVLPGHAHYVSPLDLGTLSYEKNGVSKQFVVTGGFLEVFEETALVLADDVEFPSEIDVAAAKANLALLEKKLGQESLDPEEFDAATRQRSLEQARIEAAS